MLKIYQNYEPDKVLNREVFDYSEQEKTVDEILKAVRAEGDKALRLYAKKFDNALIDSFLLSEEEIQSAVKAIDEKFLAAIKKAKDNIERFHLAQKREGFEIKKDGIVLGQKITPIKRVGVYIPGGTASYPSTVLMNVIPAVIAGCEEIILCTPYGKNGIKNEIIATASLVGVKKIFKIGGAQAIAAMAFGTESVPKVDKIVGPGNIYVACAKRKVFGAVGIDMVAGPSEILILADETARADFIAADLLSQAEHDALASAVLVTNSLVLAKAVQEEVEKQLKTLSREKFARASIETNGKILIVESIEKGVELCNYIAPEHLEVSVKESEKWLNKLVNAGSVFVGSFTPEPVGDYFAGANHTLPTNGSARFSSALSVDDFIKKTQYIKYDKEALLQASDSIITLAEAEGLTAHAAAVKVRCEK